MHFCVLVKLLVIQSPFRGPYPVANVIHPIPIPKQKYKPTPCINKHVLMYSTIPDFHVSLLYGPLTVINTAENKAE